MNPGLLDLKTGNYKVNGTTVIDTSRNLHNIGAITASGDMTIGTDSLFVDVSADQVAIGHTSPSRNLHIKGSGATVGAKIEATDGSQASLDLTNSEGAYRLISDGGQFFIYDDTDSRQPFTINTSGTTILKGGTSGTSDHALIVRNSSSTALFSIRNDGRIDVGGSQILDISRNMSNIGTISSGTITSSGNIDVNSDSGQLQFGADNDMQMFHNGAKGEINIATGNFDIDSAGEITLDADTSGVIRLKDGGTEFGKISQNSNNLRMLTVFQMAIYCCKVMMVAQPLQRYNLICQQVVQQYSILMFVFLIMPNLWQVLVKTYKYFIMELIQ